MSKTLNRQDWQARADAHAERAELLTRPHLERKARRIKHPVEDFLFTYYNLKPAQLKRWHPGAGFVLEDAQDRQEMKWYRQALNDASGAEVDAAAFIARRGATVDYIEKLLSATLDRTPSYGCFGLHEWAMVYRMSPEQIRHQGLPLRIGAEATNEVVESYPIRCSHFDAYRFFTPEAAPLNELRPTRANQPETEQPGCLHAGMDVYKWTMKLGPLIPGELLLDTFVLARDIREVDMQASPYDVQEYGLEPITIETPDGKLDYAARQRIFAERGNVLRVRVLEAIATSRRSV